MKRILTTMVVVLAMLGHSPCSTALGVSLNPYGHIALEPSERPAGTPPRYFMDQGRFFIEHNNMVFVGNAFFEAANVYLTMTTIDSRSVDLHIYAKDGSLNFQTTFKKVINISFSRNQEYAAFFDGSALVVLNLDSHAVTRFSASTIFSVDNGGRPVYYNQQTQSVWYQARSLPFDDLPSRMLFFNDVPLIFTSKNIYSLRDDQLIASFEFDGIFFEAKVLNNSLYVAEKRVIGSDYNFVLYRTDDGITFEVTDETALMKKSSLYQIEALAVHEAIRAPLLYSEDNYPFPIGNSHGEIQNYGGDPYLHPGVDFLGDDYQEVYAVKGGTVKAILTTGGAAYWRMAIAEVETTAETEGYLYAHLNQSSIPFAVGETVNSGDFIGTLYPWSVAEFTHVHFARIRDSGAVWDGQWWTVDNPLVDVTNIRDDTAPIFENTYAGDLFAFRAPNGAFLDPTDLNGEFDIIVKCHDIANSTWRIDVWDLRYSLHPAGDPDSVVMEQLAYAFDMPLDVYGSGEFTTMVLNTIYSRQAPLISEGNYDNREYYHIITNSNGDSEITAEDAQMNFDSTQFANGDYILRVVARDGSLNETTAEMNITIHNTQVTTVYFDDFESAAGWNTNPDGTDSAATGMWERNNPQGTDSSGPKQLNSTVSGANCLVTGALAGSSVGTHDVDGGRTSILSPQITLPAGGDLSLSFHYYLAHTSNSSSADYLRVKVVGSTTATVFEELGAAVDDDAQWDSYAADITSFAGQAIYILIEAADNDGGSIVEAAIDDLEILVSGGCEYDSDCSDGLFCNGVETCVGGVCQAGADPCPGQGCDEAADVCLPAGSCSHTTGFEAGAGGWTNGADTCTTGSFVVGTPDATDWQVGGGNPGAAFFTQANPGGIGTDDVDGGTCEALSPLVDCDGRAAAEVSLDYYHGQRDAGDDAADGFTIEVLSDGAVVDTLVAIGDVTSNATWTTVSTVVQNPGEIQVRVRATDAAATGDIVEGGIDNVVIQSSGCEIDADCDDGQFCNGAETCAAGVCQAGSAPCEGSGLLCDEAGDACVECLLDSDCDDGLFCNGAETCFGGSCQAGPAVDCNDSIDCTLDACNEGTDACDNVPDDNFCDNGVFCDGAETCDAGSGCQPGSDPCAGQFCDEGSDTCYECEVDADCDDGQFCNGAETCFSGVCQAGDDPCPGEGCDEAGDVCLPAGSCLYDTDFESGAGGWTNGADTCTTGSFVVGEPDATAWQVGGGNPDTAFFTQPNSGGIGTDDVDGGTCEAMSPIVDCAGQAAAEVSLDYYHGQRDAGDDAADGFTIEVLNDGVVVDTLVAIGDVTNNPSWTRVSTVVPNPGAIQVRVRATDAAGPGDIVEGGIDNVQIVAFGCEIDADCEDGVFCNGAETCDSGVCQAGSDPCPGQGCDEDSDQCLVSPTAQFEAGTVMVGSTAQTVFLAETYISPVVVCSVQYANNVVPVVARVSNVTTDSFDVYLQNPSGGAVFAEEVSFLVMEEGVWTIDGVKVEAQKYLSTITDENNSWVGSVRSYGQSYANPVVVGQVMSANDPDWSVFWCQGSSRNAPPSSSALTTGKTVCEDTDTTRADETVGFIVFEAGHGTIGGVDFEAFVGADTVRGVTNSPPYRYTFNSPFGSAPMVAVTTMAGVDGGNGGWSYTYGAAPITATTLDLSIDEDQVGDSERNHTTEQVGYVVFHSDIAYP